MSTAKSTIHHSQLPPADRFRTPVYTKWQINRLEKIVSIFGFDYFRGKTVLELACGHGHIGGQFRTVLGATVVFAEGRAEHLPYIRANNPGADVFQLNQEFEWSLGRRFDAIIHFGVTYHLVNWQQDLRCAMEHSGLVIYETEVTDSLSPTQVRRFKDPQGFDQALNDASWGSRPSAKFIENEIVQNGGTFVRYDDSALNAGAHIYDWPETGSADQIPDENYSYKTELGKRRFWVIRC
ncbi:MAG: methyltransferase domain-containing protein [Rhodospirillaceae bacterium]|nr:methyltransferase domain-containing protein [Rhodospirillaceae bacterium]